MQQRKLGKSGLIVPALGLGCMGMSISYGEPDDEESIATMQRALDLGVNLLVTSDAYGAGVNEELVGRAIKGVEHAVRSTETAAQRAAVFAFEVARSAARFGLLRPLALDRHPQRGRRLTKSAALPQAAGSRKPSAEQQTT